jgi:hypothetical protein
MEALLLYQVKVAVLVAVLFGGYRLLLGRETFHRFNRVVLITIALLSFVLPLFHITRPAPEPQPFFPPVAAQSQMEDYEVLAAQRADHINPLTILLVLYGAGVLFVLVKKGISVWAMSRIIRKGRYADRSEGVDVIESDQIPGPLNWMRFVVMPHDWLESENASVWKHENLHAHRWHSLDLLMADVMTAFQWFNPVMILLRKEFELIHEFEADQAVIESGANPKEYKLMLVSAVAANRGMALTSWLKQSNLKKRIDMMDKKQSNGWSRLRALFIPAIAYLFLFATANVNNASAQNFEFHWPIFENGQVWYFMDGTAKVRTFDGVQASMKADEVADYLKNYTKFKTTRMTLMFEYDFESLADVQPYVEQLYAVGIRTNIANNEDMLARMEQPEFRLARVYDEGNGQYRFEVICNSHNDRLNHFFSRGQFEYRYNDPSITGDMELMKKWINMFDGVALAIYPKTMPYSDLEQLAQTAWDSGKDQVSAVISYTEFDPCMFTPIAKGSNLAAQYPGKNAYDVIINYNRARSSDYFGKGVHIVQPRSFFNTDSRFYNITDIVKTDKELIVIFKSTQYSDLWVKEDEDWSVEIDGQVFSASKYESLTGYEHVMFWCPDNAYYISAVHFDVAIPDDVKTVNLLDSDDGNEVISGLQITEEPINYDDIRVVQTNGMVELKTTHRKNDNVRDYFEVHRIDFSDEQTKVYVSMCLRQAPTFPGYVGSDITIILSDDQEVKATKVIGVPTDEDFDRHGDYVDTHFKIVFPPISKEDWDKGENTLKINICHEPVTIGLNPPPSLNVSMDIVDNLDAGQYRGEIYRFELLKGVEGNVMNQTDEYRIEKIEIDSKGKMTLTGSKSELFPDGKYTLSWSKPKSEDETSKVEIKGKKVKKEFTVTRIALGDRLIQYHLSTDPDEEAFVISLAPFQE